MKDKETIKLEIQDDIREMSELIGLLSAKYSNDPLLHDIQKKFLGLSTHVGRALDIQLQENIYLLLPEKCYVQCPSAPLYTATAITP